MGNDSNARKPFVVEVLGLAGSGKSTLVDRLPRLDARFAELVLPDCRAARDLPFFVRETLRAVPDFLRLRKAAVPRVTIAELAQMAIVAGLTERAITGKREKADVLLLDQGPLFILPHLQLFGSPAFATEPARAWREKMYALWARVYDCVVWLEGDDAVLRQRVLDRPRDHALKTREAVEAREWQASYRDAFSRSIEILLRFGGHAVVLTFDTTGHSPETLATAVRERVLATVVERDGSKYGSRQGASSDGVG
jgi:hypothetical protein